MTHYGSLWLCGIDFTVNYLFPCKKYTSDDNIFLTFQNFSDSESSDEEELGGMFKVLKKDDELQKKVDVANDVDTSMYPNKQIADWDQVRIHHGN